MEVTFRQYQGLAGELDILLICESNSGHSVSRLYRHTGIFANWNLKRARRKLMRKMELLTGSPVVIKIK